MHNVLRQTSEKFKIYEALLQKWQKAVNLISPKTLHDIRGRHIEDSLQLAPLIAQNLCVFDLGSGAGFPGMVLAMARSDLDVHLIESDQKKCSFLETVSRETKTSVTIHRCRIEDYKGMARPDVITARALAPLVELMDLSTAFAQSRPGLILLFLKGRTFQSEIDFAAQHYDFDCIHVPSETNNESSILKISNLSRLNSFNQI